MTTDTAPQTAHTAQTNVIKALSQQIWGSEWLILDEYGDSDGRLERTLAGKLIDALHDVRRLPIDRMDDGEKLDALTAILAGEPVIVPEVEEVLEPEIAPAAEGPNPQPVVEDAPQRVVEAYRQAHMDRKPFTGRHGTRKAFKWHETHGEAPCDECRAIVERVKSPRRTPRIHANPAP